MKSLSAGLAAHIAQEVTTLAMCWKCTRADNAVFGFTTHDRDLTVDGTDYQAVTGFTPSQMQWTAHLAVDNLEVVGVLDSAAITEDDVRAGLWDFAQIEIFYVNWADLSQGRSVMVKGRLGEVRTGRNSFVAELRGLMQSLQQQHGRIYSASCDADLGDSRCGVNLPSMTVGSTITGIGANPRKVFADNSRVEPDGWFDGGRITFTSGDNAGQSVEVKSYELSGGVIAVQLALPYDVAPGDGYTMSPGCFKRFSTDCVGKFANGVNFRGFPDVPGMDRILTGT